MEQKLFLRGCEVIAVGQASLLQAEQQVMGCRACTPAASLPFEVALHELLKTSETTEYFLGIPAACPRCDAPIFEKTLIECGRRTNDALNRLRYVDARDEGQDIVLVDEATLDEAEILVVGCEVCSDDPQLLFDQLLDAVTGRDPATTEYLLCRTARCCFCQSEVTEKTLVLAR